jgi:hypothetical protein
MAFKAFADDTTTLNIDGDDFTVTNDLARIVISGTLEVTRDKAGLAAALNLQGVIASIIEALQHDSALPDHVKEEPTRPTGTVKNPFA